LASISSDGSRKATATNSGPPKAFGDTKTAKKAEVHPVPIDDSSKVPLNGPDGPSIEVLSEGNLVETNLEKEFNDYDSANDEADDIENVD
jgi:hypothetical protein